MLKALNLLNKAEQFVFRLVDRQLREALRIDEPEKTSVTAAGWTDWVEAREELPHYDVECISSLSLEANWRGTFVTTLEDDKHYEVDYNPETGAARVTVFKKVDTYVFPD